MFTDTVGFSAAAQTNESAALRLLAEQAGVVRPVLQSFHGREIKSTGDGFLVEFESALRATECAIEIQRQLRERNSRPGRVPIQVRIGIHLGDIEQQGTDILGDAVNIAARVEPEAEPGGVCVSQQVYDQVRSKLPNTFEKLPPRELKNLSFPVDLYRIVMPGGPAATVTHSDALPRIAVLPFVNFSPDPNDAYFADGLTEELISGLSQLREIRVLARTSVFSYKTTTKSVAQIGAELGAGSVLEGSVRKSGDHVRITAQLIDARSQEHLWSQTYDRKLHDIFTVQTEVARRVARALKIRLQPSESARLKGRRLPRPDSYLAYLKGRTLLRGQWGGQNSRAARAEFERAIDLDPSNAWAYSGLADALLSLVYGQYVEDHQSTIQAAREAATRASELDPGLAEARCSLALILAWDYDWPGAEREFLRAISLNPSYGYAHGSYASLLEDMGRGDEAVRETELEEILDPHSMLMFDHRVHLLVWMGRIDEARAVCDRLARIAPGSVPHEIALAWLRFGEGNLSESLEHMNRIEKMDPEPWTRVPKAWLYAKLGDKEKARRLLEEANASGRRYFGPWGFAVGYAFLDDFDEAFRILFEAAETHEIGLAMFRLLRDLESFRRDPRFTELLKRINLA
jgi:adenylate cyclase